MLKRGQGTAAGSQLSSAHEDPGISRLRVGCCRCGPLQGWIWAVFARKAPLDAELATHQKTAARTQREREDIRRRHEKLQQERKALEESLRKPATAESTAAADRAKAETRLAALSAEQPQLEAQQVRLAEAGALAASDVERIKAAIAPLQGGARSHHCGTQRSRGRREAGAGRFCARRPAGPPEAGDVSRRRDQHHEALGAALVAAGAASPALAAEMGAVAAASEAQAALQRQYDSSLADSSRMPKRTMLKFSALMLAARAALGAGGYAANQAMQSASPPASLAEDCRMLYGKRKPLEAIPEDHTASCGAARRTSTEASRREVASSTNGRLPQLRRILRKAPSGHRGLCRR